MLILCPFSCLFSWKVGKRKVLATECMQHHSAISYARGHRHIIYYTHLCVYYKFRRLRRLKLDYVRGLRYRTFVPARFVFRFPELILLPVVVSPSRSKQQAHNYRLARGGVRWVVKSTRTWPVDVWPQVSHMYWPPCSVLSRQMTWSILVCRQMIYDAKRNIRLFRGETWSNKGVIPWKRGFEGEKNDGESITTVGLWTTSRAPSNCWVTVRFEQTAGAR